MTMHAGTQMVRRDGQTMTVDDVKDAKAVGELFHDLAADAEAVEIMLDLVSESESVPDRLKIAFTSFATMVEALGDRATAYAELMEERAKRDLAEKSTPTSTEGADGENVIPFS